MSERFLPREPEVREALAEFEQRRDHGDQLPVMAIVVCHDKVIGTIWDLGLGRAFYLSKARKTRPTIMGGGHDGRRGDNQIPYIEACLPEGPRGYTDHVALSDGTPLPAPQRVWAIETLMPTRCSKGHRVLLERSVLRDAVDRYRRSGRVVTITLRVHSGEPHFGVLGSLQQ